MKVSEYILRHLKREGINHSFLITGGVLVPLVDSHKDTDIKYICTNHEQAAAMAADGYSRITGNLGVAMATSGPGASNLLTGIGCSYYDSIPTISITGQVHTSELTSTGGPRQTGFQEVNIVDMAKPITKYAKLITDSNSIRYELEKAIYLAKEGRPGPVLLDIPMDVQMAEIDEGSLQPYVPTEKQTDYNLLERQIDQAIDLIEKAERPVIILGAGVKLGKAQIRVKDFVERLGIPVAPSWGAIDVLHHNHPLFIGRFGVTAERAGNFAVQNSDLIISLGSRLDTRQTGGDPKLFARQAKKIVLDIDKSELEKERGLEIDIAINFDINNFLDVMNRKEIRTKDLSSWKRQIDSWKKQYPLCLPEYSNEKNFVNPYVFIDALSDASKQGDTIITDAGANLTWAMQAWKVKENQKLFSAFGYSPMGYSLPASIGASIASGNNPVICIIGDGGIKMNIQEFETIVKLGLPIKIFEFNNNGYGMIKQFLDGLCDGRHDASCPEKGLGNTDLLRIANSFGMTTLQITSHEGMHKKIKDVLDYNGPILCEVQIDPEKRVIPRSTFGKPIEDMIPALPREEFNRNMFVPPINSN